MDFSVVGFWPDSGQRFSTFVQADDADTAEALCLEQHPGVAVCGVINGRHACVESAQAVSFQFRES